MIGYRQTLRYLYSQLPMFHRIGAAAYKADLNNTLTLCRLLDDPQHSFRSIHVAGTNGKGSVSHLIASILQESGLKVGLYTSPHLIDFRERIRINGKPIPKRSVISFISRYRDEFERIRPSFFEMTVGLAFSFFREESVDVAVIEAGLGGRLDSTNVITPMLSVITNIGHDHQEFLGNTLEKIAYEKAGIIKHHVPVVIGETQEETAGVFTKKAREMDAPVTFADQRVSLRLSPDNHTGQLLDGFDLWKDDVFYLGGIRSPLKGFYQVKNIATTVEAAIEMSRLGLPVSDTSLRKGIENGITNTGLMGRWQVIGREPLIICDVGHNLEGIRQVMNQLQTIPCRHLHLVIGMVSDKDISAILKLLPVEATYYFCKARIPRAMDQALLSVAAGNQGLKGKAYSSVRKALAGARACAGPEDIVFVGGSTFVVAEVINPRSPGA